MEQMSELPESRLSKGNSKELLKTKTVIENGLRGRTVEI